MIDTTKAKEENWVEQELARRYLIGAIRYLHGTYVGSEWAYQRTGCEDATFILVGKLNRQTPGFVEFLHKIDDKIDKRDSVNR